MDLFASHAQNRNGVLCLNETDIRTLLETLGETPDERSIHYLFELADADHNGVIDFDEFLEHADVFLNNNPARLILVVGGPGSGAFLRCFCYCVFRFCWRLSNQSNCNTFVSSQAREYYVKSWSSTAMSFI